MALYVIGDLHLSLGSDKPMDVFPGWQDYVQRIEKNWKSKIKDADTVVLAGDTSWAMSLEQIRTDMDFISSLPGQKIILKGNHDYWWTTAKKMNDFLHSGGYHDVRILHNNCFFEQGVAICGSRGWMFDQGKPADQKVMAREASRLRASLDAAAGFEGERIVFLHYPPVYGDQIAGEMMDVLLEYGIRRCYYGHIHGTGHAYAVNYEYLGIDFKLISADFIRFDPVLVNL